MLHGYVSGKILKAFSKSHRNKIRRFEGGDKVLHELFISVPVTFKHTVWVESAVFCFVLGNKYVVTYLDCIFLEETVS